MKGICTIARPSHPHPLSLVHTYTNEDNAYYRSLRGYSNVSPIEHAVVLYCNNMTDKDLLIRIIKNGRYDDDIQKNCLSYALTCNNFDAINLLGSHGFNLCNSKTLIHSLSEYGDNYSSLAKYILSSPGFSHYTTKKRKLYNI